MRHVTPLQTNSPLPTPLPFPIPPTPHHHLPPSSGREREEGKEGPPSLGSQPLNQALSHPVNLKQSRFNSSCLSAPGQRQGGRLGSLAGTDQPTEGPRRRRNRADRRGDAPEDTSPHTNTPLSLQSPLLALPSFPLQFLHFSAALFEFFFPSVVYKLL